jgi:hypothetical protein
MENVSNTRAAPASARFRRNDDGGRQTVGGLGMILGGRPILTEGSVVGEGDANHGRQNAETAIHEPTNPSVLDAVFRT